MRAALVGLAALVLAACASQPLSAEQELAISCRGYSATLAILAPLKPTMSGEQIAIVDGTIDVVSPICRAAAAGTLPTAAAVLSQVRFELRKLLIVESEVRP